MCNTEDLDIKQITERLINAAKDLRDRADEIAAAARAGWGNYCLNFFCCASSPVQYNESRLYLLIEWALQKAQGKNIIEAIDLEKQTNPADRQPPEP